MKNLLVVADRNQQHQPAFDKAVSLAKLTDAHIHVVAFCYEDLHWFSGSDNHYEQAKEQSMTLLDNWWKDYIDHQATAQLVISQQVVWEKYPADWLATHTCEQHYDLLLKTGHRSESTLHTPTDWLILREVKAPVYLLTEEHRKETRSVLVALDLLAKSEEKQRLNEQLLEAAFRLATETASDLHCCYAIQIPTIVRDMDLIDVSAESHKLEKSARERSQALLDTYGLDSAHIHIKEGSAWKVISSLADQFQANCIVIGSMGRKGIAGKFIGNTAEKVIHVAQKDLYVIGPHD